MKKKSTVKKANAPVSTGNPSALKKKPAKTVKAQSGSEGKPKPFPVVDIGINEELHISNLDLKDLNDYADAIFESKHEALIILDNELRVRIANKGFYSLFNVTKKETEGVYFSELGNQQWNISEIGHQLQQMRQRQVNVFSREVSFALPGGELKNYLLNAQVLPLKKSRKILIMVAIHDFTEIMISEKRLRESEERFRLLIQNSFDIITLFDRDGTIKYISPSVEHVLGFTAEEKIGKNIFLHTDTHPDDHGLKEAMIRDSVASPGKNIRTHFRLQHKSGDYRHIEAVATNLLEDVRVNGIIANYRDITDRKILEQQKDDFIGIASHELKTPVTSIKAYAQILQEDFLESGNTHAATMAEKMNGQIDRLTKLISDLLDFTHVAVDKMKFREESYGINQLVKETVVDMQRTTDKQLEIKTGEEVMLFGDRFRIGEVLNNLLSNAIKYGPQARKIKISTALKKEERVVIISVADNGIGIDPAKADKIFDRFYRVSDDSVNTFPGLGLGLYLAAEIVKKQGGRIWMDSKPGKGSTFYFSLPVRGASNA